MPAKNVVKIYVSNGVYHIYNRGVEKRTIFEESYDYHVFENCLKEALLPPSEIPIAPISFTLKGLSFQGMRKPVKNYAGVIDVLAYCLMPNHFHLLVQQKTERAIDSFMRSISTRYSMYFNKKYDHVGSLFQGSYRATLVDSDPYLLQVSRYIHRNPIKVTKKLIDWHSSYAQYLGKRNDHWVKPDFILALFQPSTVLVLKNVNSYQRFVEYENRDEEALSSDLTLDDDL